MEYDYAVMAHEDFLDEREDWKQMEEFSKQIQLKIREEGYTVEDISNYIQTNAGRAFNMESVDLWDCRKTENDLRRFYFYFCKLRHMYNRRKSNERIKAARANKILVCLVTKVL